MNNLKDYSYNSHHLKTMEYNDQLPNQLFEKSIFLKQRAHLLD